MVRAYRRGQAEVAWPRRPVRPAGRC